MCVCVCFCVLGGGGGGIVLHTFFFLEGQGGRREGVDEVSRRRASRSCPGRMKQLEQRCFIRRGGDHERTRPRC